MASSSGLQVSERCRVVVDNDWSGDPDGLVALVHHLLSPANGVLAVTSSFLSPEFATSTSTAEEGALLARELVDLVGGPTRPTIYTGSETPFNAGDAASAASDAIIEEAQRESALPLYLVCGGPLTNVAAALQQAPDIADRLTLVWIGGSLESERYEYNRDTDEAAAEFVLTRPGLAVHQFPVETYRRCPYSLAELEYDLGASGQLGNWLWHRFSSLPLPDWLRLGGVWPLGDSPPLIVTALTDESSTFTTTPAGVDRGELRVYTDIDFRLIVGDLLAKLRLHEQRQGLDVQ
jgi:purine nucleosidase